MGRRLFEENNANVAAIYAKGRHRQWAKAVRELSLGGKDQYFEAAKDSEKLSKIVVVLKNEFSSAGPNLSSFEFDDLTKEVIPKVNELLYDTLAYIVKSDSAAEHFLLGTDSVSDRDGRRALLDLVKECVPPGVRQTLPEEHSQLRYPARVDPRPLLAREQRLARDNRSEDWTPTEMPRKYKLFERLDPEFYAAVRVRYPMPADLRPVPLSTLTNLVTHIFVAWEQQQVELGVATGPSVAGAAYSGVDERVIEVLGQLTTRLEKIEAAIKFQKAGGAASSLPRNRRGNIACPLMARVQTRPCTRTLALCHIFQVAADDGSEAFAAAMAEYGAPAVLAGGESDGIDVSAYGFAVSDSGSGVMSELESLTGQVRAMEEKVGMHLSHISLLDNDDVREHPAPVVRPLRLITTAYRPRNFPGGVELVPVQHYVPFMTIDQGILLTVAGRPGAVAHHSGPNAGRWDVWVRAVTFIMKIAKFIQIYAIFALSPYLKLKFRACGGQFWRLAVLTESGPVDLPVAGRKGKREAIHPAIDPLISTVACSFEPAAESFVEPAEAFGSISIDEFLAGSETDELDQSESEESFVGTLYGEPANRPRQVMGPTK
ncbi:hypothetical protein CYMTET_8711 [Cymbomonas tetramitiformis]|uniref:Uncharacterized protein n=1 Tax=Cymbomonas tetramitiformis TaxID=36881 RepID=A0AAE0LG92_9CHLO|nr:hypothetical protein CYMTET_8711 [Cymbomonas tetramitiformis]